MIDCTKVSKLLHKIYDNKIICRIGNGEPVYNINKTKYVDADIAIYIHENYRIAIVWNLERRRLYNRVITSLSLDNDWGNLIPNQGEIKAFYKRMGTDREAPYEKVLVLDLETLLLISEKIYLYLKINPLDAEYPIENKDVKLEPYDCLDNITRNLVSTSRWERDKRFRNSVLDAYGNKCAICRCNEVKLLEAAHIVAVADGGTDNPKNGICLCANHHIMFDKELIKINHDEHTLTYVEESVKEMSWYEEFNNKFFGKVISPKFK